MKSQWMLILGFVFALVIALFAIVNVGSVEFNYLFGTTNTPLILIILISTLFGGLTVGFLGMFKIYVLSKQLKQYEKEWKVRGLDPLPEQSPRFKRKTKNDESASSTYASSEDKHSSFDTSDSGGSSD